MKGSIVINLLVFLLLASCRSSKNIETQEQRDYSGYFEKLYRQTDSLLGTIQMNQQETRDKLSNLKVENKTVYYSAPDSTGKQYPVVVSETKSDKDEKESTQRYTQLDATIRQLTYKLDSLSNKIDAALKREQKVVEVSWWDLHKWQLFTGLGVVLLIVVGYLIYKLKKGGGIMK